ncbi:MAG: hypothetical protein EOP47_27370 [Sphingobacteriaceae bacterium]|nr:MAG: hypothetical protein EOP47_27370 [Sphingobacteriaceae bacterium]
MRLLYLFAFILLPFISFSQSNYQQGYVLKNNGDTLKGYINTREWARNPKFIEFKNAKESQEILRFNVIDLKGFHVSPYTSYLSYTGRISNNKNQFPEIDDLRDTTTHLDTAFLKLLFKGTHVSLYTHSDNNKDRFFYQETGQGPVEFKYYQYHNINGGIDQSKIYAGQLSMLSNNYWGNDKSKLRTIQQADFNEADMISSFELINGARLKKADRPAGTRLFFGAGLNYTSTAFYGDNRFTKSGPQKTYSPKLSAGYDIFINPVVQQFYLRAEMSFSYVKANFTSPDNIVDQPSYTRYTFNQYNIALAPQLIYNVYNKENLKFYLGIGAAFNYSFYTNNKLTTYSFGAVGQSQPYELQKLWMNFPVQAGVTINKRFDLALSRSGRAGFTTYTGFSIASEVWGISLKYLFDKNHQLDN